MKLLLGGEVEEIFKELSRMQKNRSDEKLIDCYEANKTRMNYPLYQKIGISIIGFGAIESVQRTVVQKRLKQSGQRRGRLEAQNILTLRVTKKITNGRRLSLLARKNLKARQLNAKI